MRILFADLPWRGKRYAGRAGMRWAHTSDKIPVISFRPFPFYIACAAAVAEKESHTVKVIDALAEKLGEEEFYRRVIDFKPDFIIAETHTPSYNNDRSIAKELKKRTKAKIVFCGPHATALPEDVTKENKGVVDYVIVGEYEFLLMDLINGKKKGSIIKSDEVVDINKIPWPARHLFNMKLYNEVICRNYPNVHLMASRGCPFRCSYCNIYLMNKCRKQRCRNPKDVIEEMKYCIRKYKPKELYFDDDNIDANPKWLEELMDLKIKEGIKMPFSCMGHVSIKPELLEKMRKAGLRAMKFGIESTNNEVLRRLGKGITKEMAIRTIKKCKELGIKTHLTYCIGLPGDTEETVKETVKFAKKYGDHYQVSIAAPFPGTPLFEEAKQNGWLNFRSWDDFDGMKDAIINYPHLSSKRLYKIYCEAQSYTYWKVLKDGEWVKYLRMIYQERGLKGLAKLFFVRGPGMLKEVVTSKVRKK